MTPVRLEPAAPRSRVRLRFANKMLVIRAGIHKMLAKMANREDPDQTAFSKAV